MILILMLFLIEEKIKSAQHCFSPFNDCPKYIKKEIFMHDKTQPQGCVRISFFFFNILEIRIKKSNISTVPPPSP